MKNRFLLAMLTLLTLMPAALRAQSDLYSFPKIEEPVIKKEKEKKPAGPFAVALARKFELPEESLDKWQEEGLGRMELVRLILLARRARKPLEEVVQERKKGTSFAKIAKTLDQNNLEVRKAAELILKELEQEEKKVREEQAAKKTKVAGAQESTGTKKESKGN